MSDFDSLLDSQSEHAEQNDALMAITALPEIFAYRQNTGTAWQGKPVDVPPGEYVRVTPGMKILASARPIDFGLKGAGDITGHKRGRAFQIEMKTLTGEHKKHQEAFGRVWTQRGGIYILARSGDDALSQISKI